MPVGGLPPMTRGAWLRIPWRYVKKVEQLKSDLTIANPAFFRAQMYDESAEVDESKAYLKLFREDEHAIYVPRAFDWDAYVGRFDVPILDVPRSYSRVVWPEDTIELGPNKHQPYDQRDAFAALSAPPVDTKGRLFVLGCGRGKTVLALKAALTRPGPLGVIVDMNALATQWVERIDEFLGIAPGSIGRVQGPQFDWEGYPITIMMAQTLMQRDEDEWPEEFRRYFQLVVLDEIHAMGAPVLGKALSLFYGERWGLTATITRADGLDRVYREHLAAKPCFVDVEQDLVPEVILVEMGRPCPDLYTITKEVKCVECNGTGDGPCLKCRGTGALAFRQRWTAERLVSATDKTRQAIAHAVGIPMMEYRADRLLPALIRRRRGNVASTITKITRDAVRNEAMLRVLDMIEAQGRTTLVLGSRTEQLIALYNAYTGDKGLVYGKMKDMAKREEQLREHRVVFAAQKIVKKGLDRKTLDTLVYLATDPELCTDNNVQQGFGRIQRAAQGKKAIRAYMFIDGSSLVLAGSLKKFIKNAKKVMGRNLVIRKTTIEELLENGLEG